MAKPSGTKPTKGTRDFLPKDIYRREYVTGIIREVYEAHGFQPLETPAFERLETLTGKYGEEGDQLLFKVLKRGQQLVAGVRDASLFLEGPGAIVVGRTGETAPGAEPILSDLGLRYDLTVPLSRVYANQQAKLPSVFRRYQIQPVWRADNPGKGRFREFYQCDVDVVGTTSLLAEAEVAGAVCQCLDRLGFTDFEVKLNHRQLLSAVIQHAGVDPKHAGEAIIAIDKLDKIGAEGVEKELADKGLAEDARTKLMELVLGEPDLERMAKLLGGHPAVEEVRRLLQLAEATPAAKRLAFSPTLARGLGYYTGCIFEIAVEDLAGSLGGGGRYDQLIGMFLGRDVPAVGFSIGLERILFVMEQREMFPEHIGRQPEVVVAAVAEGQLDAALGLAYELRSAGLRVELSPKVEKPGKVRKSADERHIGFAVLVRDDGLNVWSRAEPKVTDRMVPRAELKAFLSA